MNKQAEEREAVGIAKDFLLALDMVPDRKSRLEAVVCFFRGLKAGAQAEQERAVRAARIDELRDYPLNWADNRKDTVWRSMLISRIDQLQKGDSDG